MYVRFCSKWYYNRLLEKWYSKIKIRNKGTRYNTEWDFLIKWNRQRAESLLHSLETFQKTSTLSNRTKAFFFYIRPVTEYWETIPMAALLPQNSCLTRKIHIWDHILRLLQSSIKSKNLKKVSKLDFALSWQELQHFGLTWLLKAFNTRLTVVADLQIPALKSFLKKVNIVLNRDIKRLSNHIEASYMQTQVALEHCWKIVNSFQPTIKTFVASESCTRICL